MNKYKYIYPANAREQEQLDTMIRLERADKDPLAPEYIEQPILFKSRFWFVTHNRFPYEGAEKHFLVVAMEPVYSVMDLTEEMWGDLRLVWRRLVQEYGMDGGGLCFRFGNPAKSGASLTRVHCHFIEPKANQKVKPSIGGRQKLREGLHL